MAKQRRTVKKTRAEPDTDAALTVLCGSSRAARRKAYAKAIGAKAKHDAATFALFLHELGLPAGASERQVAEFTDAVRRTLASIFLASLLPDAQYSVELARLAYRLLLDATTEVTGDVRRFRVEPVDRGRVIIERPAAREALLPRAPGEPVREYATPFAVAFIDRMLLGERDLGWLQHCVAALFGRTPTKNDGLRQAVHENEPDELLLEVSTEHRIVRFCGVEVRLPYHQTDLLIRLCEAGGMPVSDAEIRASAWGLPSAGPNQLRSDVARVRAALKEAAANVKSAKLRRRARETATVVIPAKQRGVGYRIGIPDLIRFI